MRYRPPPPAEARLHRFRLRVGLASLALVPILLAAIAVWFGTEYQRLSQTEAEVRHAHERQILFSELFSAIKDAETGQRGFIITGDDAFLEPYRLGQSDVRRLFGRLRDLSTSPAEELPLDRLGKLVDAKFREMERLMALRRAQGLAEAAAAVGRGEGKRLMDAIRGEALAARTVEANRLGQTLEHQNERTRTTERIFWIVIALVALAMTVLAILFLRNERRRAALEQVANEAAARLGSIFDSTLDAIVLVNPSGSIETINRAASRLFGYAGADLIRRDISLIVDLAPGDGPFLDRIGLGPDGLAEPFRHHLVAHRADGTPLPIEAALGVMPLPDGMHIVAALRDISERDRAERIKDQFLSTVSHELRTPLTSIVGSLSLLRGGINGELSASAQRLLVIAENNANRLIRLVNDLLDIEKLESGEMSFDFRPVDLREVGGRALDAVRGMAQGREIALDFAQDAEPVIVRGDAERLIQVFANLLANAIRFTPEGRRVSLIVRRRANHAEASVSDEGPGVDEELRRRLFTRFAQSIQGPVGQSRGTGLGLAISREIVRNHGGGIWYEPASGGGSVFSFDLPLWDAIADDPGGAAAPRVLIRSAEGEGRTIADALAGQAIRVDIVDSNETMMDALGRQRYLALLVDCRCVGGDTRLLHRIRSDPARRNLPIIAIAGGDEDPAEFASLDVVDWIPRPLDTDRLGTAVASVAARARHTMPLVLHVDDDTDTLEITARALAGRARVAYATNIATARTLIARDRPDVVIVDLALPDGSGEDLLADLALSGDLTTPVIIYSAQERNGAFAREVSAVLTKSKRSLSALVETIHEILDRQSDERVG